MATAQRLRRWSGLASSGMLALFVAMSVVNLSAFVFNLVMSRLLGVAVYGALGSLLSLVTIVGIAAGGVQAAVTQSVAAAGGGTGDAWGQRVGIGRPLAWASGVGGAGMVAVAAATPAVRSFLHLGSTPPVLWLAVYLVPAVALLVPQGVLLGQMRFRAVALANVAGAGTRLLAGVALVGTGSGLGGAVAASALGAALTLTLLVWPLRHDLRPRLVTARLRLRLDATVLSVVSVGGFSLFLGVDSVLARHYLTRVASGYYVAGLTAARIALFLPGAVVTIAFPYFAHSHRHRPHAARRQLSWALLVVGALGAGAAAIMLVVPGLIVTTLFGARYRPAGGVVGVLALASTALGLVNLLTYFHLSRRSRHSLTAWAGMAAAAAGIAAFHHSPHAIAMVMLVVSSAMLATMLVPALRPHRAVGADDTPPQVGSG